MSNVEVRYSVYFMKMKARSDTTLRHSAVRYSKFCGWLFKSDPAIGAVDLIQMDTSIYGVPYLVNTHPKRSLGKRMGHRTPEPLNP